MKYRLAAVIVLITGIISFFFWYKSGPDEISFTVFTDIHLYSKKLGNSGPQFIEYLNADPKMLLESEAIFAQAVSNLTESDPAPDFVMICGDLTKDGERTNHLLAAAYLKRIEAAGIEVFVIPGNHDIDNPEAVSYGKSETIPVESVGPDEFAGIYADFGYAQAIARDPNSLSYVAEPVPGYWLFALDSCRYRENRERSVVAGRLGKETLQWVETQLRNAKKRDKLVIGMMHHGVMEHYRGQADQFPDFIIEEWENIGHMLAKSGMQLIFTGHFHAQDITRKTWEDGVSLVDIETGSLVSYPCYYRNITVNRKNARVVLKSHSIDRLPQDALPEGASAFEGYAAAFLKEKLLHLIQREAMDRYGLDEATTHQIAPMLTTAFMAHLKGNEIPDIRTFNKIMAMMDHEQEAFSSAGKLLYTLWHDLPPRDSATVMDLATGRTETPRNSR